MKGQVIKFFFINVQYSCFALIIDTGSPRRANNVKVKPIGLGATNDAYSCKS